MLTDVRCSLGHSVGYVNVRGKQGLWGISAKHVINKRDWLCNHQVLKRVNLLLSSHSATQPSAEPPTQSPLPHTHPYTSSLTHTHTHTELSMSLYFSGSFLQQLYTKFVSRALQHQDTGRKLWESWKQSSEKKNSEDKRAWETRIWVSETEKETRRGQKKVKNNMNPGCLRSQPNKHFPARPLCLYLTVNLLNKFKELMQGVCVCVCVSASLCLWG